MPAKKPDNIFYQYCKKSDKTRSGKIFLHEQYWPGSPCLCKKPCDHCEQRESERAGSGKACSPCFQQEVFLLKGANTFLHRNPHPGDMHGQAFVGACPLFLLQQQAVRILSLPQDRGSGQFQLPVLLLSALCPGSQMRRQLSLHEKGDQGLHRLSLPASQGELSRDSPAVRGNSAAHARSRAERIPRGGEAGKWT